MAGTDSTQHSIIHDDGPAIILVGPQLGENIGKAVRGMYNFGLTDLRLVAPRDGWPNPDAYPAAAGADVVLDQAQVFDTLEEAVADLHYVYATTARMRGMVKEVVTPKHCAQRMYQHVKSGKKTGLLFGREKSGLKNEDVQAADAIVTVPLNPSFASLNLAQAVTLMSYEWFQVGDETEDSYTPEHDTVPATKENYQQLFDHLEDNLTEFGYFRHLDRKPIMVQNLRNMLSRGRFTAQEISTLRGVIKVLSNQGGEGWQQEQAEKAKKAAKKSEKP